MDATAITAVIGLLATMSTAIGVPFIQGHIASKRNFATKLRDERIAAYADAMVYLRAVQGRLDETVEDPAYRQRYTWPSMPHRDLISARLGLIAPLGLVEHWDALIVAWDALSWNLQQDGPATEHGEYYVDSKSADVTRVRNASQALTTQLRQAAGAERVL